MSKAVLISIKPKWVEMIASGKKTIDVRKTRPKIEPPFKVYIYCSQTSPWNPALVYQYENPNGNIYIGGKNYSEFMSARVVGEFICDSIGFYAPEVSDYANGKPLYGWHISDLKMYDTPKELKKFSLICKHEFCQDTCPQFKYRHCDILKRTYPATKAPQSWMYVVEKED